MTNKHTPPPLSEYKKSVEAILFNEPFIDRLFINGLKPNIRDKYRFERAVKLLENPQKKRIIEIGPYPGTGVYYLGEYNKIIGIGKSTPEFTQKIEKCGSALFDIDFEKDEIPVSLCESADIVLMMEVLEHIRFPWQFLKKATSLLHKGGRLFLTTNNASYIGYILKLLFSRSILDTIETEGTFYPGHSRYYHLDELCSNLEKLEFRILHRKNVNYLPSASYYKNKFFGTVKNILINAVPVKYSTHIEIVAEKTV